MNQEQEPQIVLNGISGVTGGYMVEPLSPTQAALMARGEPTEGGHRGWLKRIWEVLQRPFMGLPMDVDPTDVGQAGWAIVFGSDTSSEVREALQPLANSSSTNPATA